MPKEQNQRGFGALGIFAILLVIAVLAFAAWFVWNKNHSAKESQSKEAATSDPAPTKEMSWRTYKHDEGGFTFQYPDSWTNRDETFDPLDTGQG